MSAARKGQGDLLAVGGKKVAVSNLEKVFYPGRGFTKGEMIDYYIKISHHILSHLKNRPVSLKRFPDGVAGKSFFEKNCPSHRPGWVRTCEVAKKEGGEVRYCVFNTLPALVWAANIAVVEFHTFLHKAASIGRPTAVAFDLDPGPPATVVECCGVALKVREALERLGLRSFPKTSGSKGLQLYVPLNTRAMTYERTKAFARTMAGYLQRHFPEAVTSQMKKELRHGKVFVDWSQNDAKKTTICAYSLRAREAPTVSTPVTWDEVETAWRRREPLRFEVADVLRRVEAMGDLFAPVLTLRQRLPKGSLL